MSPWPWTGSLRLRLLGATLVTLALALVGAHGWLTSLFRDHVMQQFDLGLAQQLDQLTARLEFDAAGRPQIDRGSMTDPRWEQPYAGLYWQIESLDGAPGRRPAVLLRSRSLWDAELQLPADALANGERHQHDTTGPRGEALRAVERSLQAGEPAASRWRLIVAGDPREAMAAVARFNGVLAASLAALGLLLVLAALAQVAVGLAPLRAMQRALQQLRQGRSQRLQGRFPAEVQPLIDDFNGVLERNDEVVTRARAQAGNLAHALKTPLAILGQAARDATPGGELPALVAEQVDLAQRQLNWHLARARAAAAPHRPGQRTALAPVLAGLLRAMAKLHADRDLQLAAAEPTAGLAFAGEAQDLQEMLGNLLDNACRSARQAVGVRAERQGPWLRITVDDDGPGIAPEQREVVLQRGVRLDESRAGSGLGLAIVVDLAQGYGGALTLGTAPAGGLSACLSLPAAD
ncbi:MAG: sensor histidine kinase [Proteobacteria bacterium]|nr:sensor histidine kinase [Pseudomonadota bacterium]